MGGSINASRGGGQSLPESTRAAMEGAMGASFADVRVHRDAESDALNRGMTAKAFTTGSDIFLRSDQDPSDHNLLAHELTHVVQQRGMTGSGGGLQVGAHDDALEVQADQVSQAVNSGAPQRRVAEEISG